jgi:hypothetical protein
MDLGAEDIGLAYQIQVCSRIICGNLIKYVVESDHKNTGQKAEGKRLKEKDQKPAAI